MPGRQDSTLQDKLAQAERHVADTEQRIREQVTRLSDLASNGHDTRQAEEVLATMRDTYRSHLKDRDRLRKEAGVSVPAGPRKH